MTQDATLGAYDPLTAPLPAADEAVSPQAPQPVDYFGFEATENWYFPDGIQFMVLQKMNEGGKAKYQAKTNSDIVLERNSGNARMKMDAATQRHELIKASVTGWNLFRRNSKTGQMEPVAFNKQTLDQWLQVADPALVEDLEKAIRKLNPWLLGEMSVEDIDREIANLQEMREIAVEREAGEGSSSSR